MRKSQPFSKHQEERCRERMGELWTATCLTHVERRGNILLLIKQGNFRFSCWKGSVGVRHVNEHFTASMRLKAFCVTMVVSFCFSAGTCDKDSGDLVLKQFFFSKIGNFVMLRCEDLFQWPLWIPVWIYSGNVSTVIENDKSGKLKVLWKLITFLFELERVGAWAKCRLNGMKSDS